MTRPAAPPRARGARPGVTLVELLLAATLGLLAVSAAGALFVSQIRAFARTRGEVAVQRDLRLGLALLPMDLRGVSRVDGDLIALRDDFVELRATVASSVLCEIADPAARTAFILPPPGLPQLALTSVFSTPRPGDTVKVLIRREAGGVGDTWLTAAVGFDSLQTVGTSAAGLCAATTSATAPARRLRVAWPTGLTAHPADQLALVVSGMPVRVLRRVRYELYQAPSGRWYLGFSDRLGNGEWSTREPIAGPFGPPSATPGGPGGGVRFAYFDTTGAPLPSPVPDPRRVGRVDVTFRARTVVRAGGTSADSVVARDSALLRVALRNRI
jgi:hypothetical protein